MAELKPFEVIMEISPIAGQNGKGELVFQVVKQTELVHCHDCKYYTKANNGCNGNCDKWNVPTYVWDYCSRSEGGVNDG